MQQERGLQYFPIALFASVMGVSGVALSLRLLEDLYAMGRILSNIFMAIATLLFVINAIMLLYRLFNFTAGVKQDFNHPVKMNFFGAISISLLLLATLYYELHEGLSFYVWIFGAVFQFLLTLITLSALIWERKYDLAHFNPAWFIPIVGNIVVPLAGVYHTSITINWIFFSIGVVFSIIYFTIFMNRIFFQPAPPQQLMPTFFILLAPPGIGFVSYIKLTGHIDVFAYIMYGLAFYLGFLLLYQWRRFFTLPFFVSWWAYLFPSAAVTNATFFIYEFTKEELFKGIFMIQIVGLLLLMIYLFYRTLKVTISGALFLKTD